MHLENQDGNTLILKMNNNYKTILITGASSFLGEALVKKLLDSTTSELILTCRNSGSCNKWKGNNRIHIVSADLMNTSDWKPVFESYRPDVVFHLAAVARFREGEQYPLTAFQVNFFGTTELIKLSLQYGTGQFLFTSSDLALNAISAVGISKYLVERIIVANSHPQLKLKGLRIANLIDGNGSVTLIFKKQIAQGEAITVTHPGMSRRFSTREEAADDLLWLLKNGKPDSMYVTHKPPFKIIDLAKKLMKDAGKETDIKIIGVRPGEKISEPSYNEFAIQPVKNRELALFESENYRNEKVSGFLEKLKVPDTVKSKAVETLKSFGIEI